MDFEMQTLEQQWDLKSLYNHEIECGSGWFPLLERFLTELSPRQRSNDVHQIKEKFGTLRIYGSLEVETIAQKYEILSAMTCEVSGKAGSLHKKGRWLMTLSSDQAEILGYQPV
jgi:hypothetical protein